VSPRRLDYPRPTSNDSVIHDLQWQVHELKRLLKELEKRVEKLEKGAKKAAVEARR
jgi:hypothetical protein